MKIAKLHTGEELQFPPETPDDVMDAKVREHLGVPPPPPPPPPMEHVLAHHQIEALRGMSQSSGDVAQQLAGCASAIAAAIQAIGDAAQAMHAAVKEMNGVGRATATAMNRMSETVSESGRRSDTALGRMTESVGEIGRRVEEASKAPARAIELFTEKMDTSVKTLESVLTARKEIVTDKSGRPIGVRTVEK